MTCDTTEEDSFRPTPSGIWIIDKSPVADLVYTEDWTAWLSASGATIASFTVTAVERQSGMDCGEALVVGTTELVGPGTGISVELSGGTNLAVYLVTITIVTTGTPPATDQRSFQVRVIQR